MLTCRIVIAAPTVFGVGNVVYCAIELRNVLQPRTNCLEKYTYGWTFVPRFVFIAVQTFVLFKGKKVVNDAIIVRLTLV